MPDVRKSCRLPRAGALFRRDGTLDQPVLVACNGGNERAANIGREAKALEAGRSGDDGAVAVEYRHMRIGAVETRNHRLGALLGRECLAVLRHREQNRVFGGPDADHLDGCAERKPPKSRGHADQKLPPVSDSRELRGSRAQLAE
ncbi:hypothetical protein [Sinorhizobium medicae]|uniref:hypothetical protein n=1 Tax=Sinorhizobium medicae TaxID=110321 RepID=UPI003969D5BC